MGPQADIELTERDDARLAGWVQSTRLTAPVGTQIRIDAVCALRPGPNEDPGKVTFKGEEALWVRLSAAAPGGEFEPWCIVFFHRPRDPDLASLDGLTELFEASMGEALPAAVTFEAMWGDRGAWPAFEDVSAQVIFDQLVGLKAGLAEVDASDRVRSLVELAYGLGRLVRQEELSSRHALTVAKAADLRRKQQEAGANSVLANSQRWDHAAVRAEYQRRWKMAPFNRVNERDAESLKEWASDRPELGPVPDVERLAKHHIPGWRRELEAAHAVAG